MLGLTEHLRTQESCSVQTWPLGGETRLTEMKGSGDHREDESITAFPSPTGNSVTGRHWTYQWTGDGNADTEGPGGCGAVRRGRCRSQVRSETAGLAQKGGVRRTHKLLGPGVWWGCVGCCDPGSARPGRLVGSHSHSLSPSWSSLPLGQLGLFQGGQAPSVSRVWVCPLPKDSLFFPPSGRWHPSPGTGLSCDQAVLKNCRTSSVHHTSTLLSFSLPPSCFFQHGGSNPGPPACQVSAPSLSCTPMAFYFERASCYITPVAWNLWSSCPSLPCSWDYSCGPLFFCFREFRNHVEYVQKHSEGASFPFGWSTEGTPQT